MKKKIFLIIIVILLNLELVNALSESNEVSVSVNDLNISNNETHFVINNWASLPHKDQRAFSDAWLDTVNNQLEPKGADWWTVFSETSMKCLSFAASTTSDWYNLESGKVFQSYTNIINGFLEKGTNPRELEQVYFTHHRWEKYFDFSFLDDVVTQEKVPYNIKGYAEIMTNPPLGDKWTNKPDSELWHPTSNFYYTIQFDEYLDGYKTKNIPIDENEIKQSLEQYGILYTHVLNNLVPFINYEKKVHSVPLIGYGVYNGTDVFWIHESYTEEYPSNYSKYKAIELQYIKEAIAFYDPTWSTFHHDYRRTGLSLLTGNLSSSTTHEDLTYEGDSLTDYWDNPAFGDVTGDGKIELVVGTSSDQTYGRVFAIDNNGKQLWSTTEHMGNNVIVPQTPSIADLDGDGYNEVVFGDWDKKLNLGAYTNEL